MQVIPEKLRQRRGGAQAEHIDGVRLKQAGHNLRKRACVNLLHGAADVEHIRLEHGGQHLGFLHLGRHFKALRGGQAMTNQLLQGMLQLRISLVAQRYGEADDRAFADMNHFAQRGRRHENGFFIMCHNVLGNAAVAFAQPLAAQVQPLDQILLAFHTQPLSSVRMAILYRKCREKCKSIS